MNRRLVFPALALLLTACSSERLTGVAAENAARQYQARERALSEEPLFFVDGKEVSATAARAMTPTTIETIEVVKGAAAVAVYGQRASRGVVVITTKAGSGGAAHLHLMEASAAQAHVSATRESLAHHTSATRTFVLHP